MVGGPRSKGCLTCRRRKIRCDLQQPTCLQCHRSKRRCGGYDRYPVFVVYTKNGMGKREALKDPESAPFSDSWRLEFRPTSEDSTPLSTPRAMLEDDLTVNEFHSISAEKSRYIGWAYESYIDTEGAKNRYTHMPVGNWLRSTLALAKADQALDTAMLAITCKMYAAFYTDQSLLIRSKHLYTGALGLLQRSLASRKAALTDETLAATCLVALYELTSLDKHGPDAWQSHIAGISAVLKARGAGRHQTALARDTFEHCRYNLMLQCLSNRNASGFASKEWLDDPWIGASKGLEQQVMDCGFKLARVLQRLDEDTFWWADIKSIRELIAACEDGTSKIKAIKRDHLRGLRLDPDPKVELSAPGAPSPGEDTSQAANRLVLRLTASAIELGLCEASSCIMQKVLESSFYAISHSGSNHWRLVDSQSCAETVVTLPTDGTELAKEMVNEAGVVLNREDLPPEVVRMVFPLKVAVRKLKHTSYCPQYEQCAAYLNYLQGRKGSNFTKLHPREYFVYGDSRHKNVLAVKAL